ncbi:photosynthetic NDH subunit of subcomplex B 5, chloroplastic [Heracleum sosnowskyi]|uniref:Photosynthetic NDH subunit of subcomplex B 5, chloroplastic n=1 Tax=Heracleum sosnowskyi TaxID=360622 RepID=A0AAD8M806_9APIA|nr:photosynthetic NDH subunit of subcomplex B 5, chloroplastic [Heracleum sosnowskyi]
MATSVSVSSLNLVPKFGFKPDPCTSRAKALVQRPLSSVKYGRLGLKRLNAGLTDIEPDLNEDPKDRWATNGVDPDDFIYGQYDDHHTYNPGDHEKVSFWESVAEDYAAIDPPTGFQGLISWLFLPTVAVAMYFDAPGEYIYIGAAIFTVVFCIIEMDKPSEPHNFEPQIYNLERKSRDKLIADYNTMDIWDFNEKYGELWDFTVKNDDIITR